MIKKIIFFLFILLQQNTQAQETCHIEPTCLTETACRTEMTWEDDSELISAPDKISVSDFRDFNHFQGVLSRQEVLNKLNIYLKKTQDTQNYYLITDDSLSLFAAKFDKDSGKPEFVLHFTKEKILSKAKSHTKFRPKTDQKYPLKGIRIALDPGHFGGRLAYLEQRYTDMAPSSEVQYRTDIKFNEGTLNFLTAKYLQKLLEEKGAIVLITRDKIGSGAYKIPFNDWMKKGFREAVEAKTASILNRDEREKQTNYWLEEAAPEVIFRNIYNPLDIKARSLKINKFKPDLAMIIHYNSSGQKRNSSGQNPGTNTNYNMVFIPGAFIHLRDLSMRYHFVRLLVSDQLEDSVQLATKLANEFSANLGIPLVSCYLQSDTTKVASGVFARNLAMTRLVKSPVVYGESLIQDNFEESERLVEKDILIDGVKTSHRVKEVAQAYFNTIMAFQE